MTKRYEVTITPQFGSYGDRSTVVEVIANTKAEAIAQARKLNNREMYYDRFNGRISYTAQEA